jgi:hypothetical protein
MPIITIVSTGRTKIDPSTTTVGYNRPVKDDCISNNKNSHGMNRSRNGRVGSGSRIPTTLQAVFLASNRGKDVHQPPPRQVAFRTFLFRGGWLRGLHPKGGHDNSNPNHRTVMTKTTAHVVDDKHDHTNHKGKRSNNEKKSTSHNKETKTDSTKRSKKKRSSNAHQKHDKNENKATNTKRNRHHDTGKAKEEGPKKVRQPLGSARQGVLQHKNL